MTEPEPLTALRRLLGTIDPLALPETFIARARKHVDGMERSLAEGPKAETTIAVTRRTSAATVAATLDDRRRLHELTTRPGYALLDAIARRLRRAATAQTPDAAAVLPEGAASDSAPPGALAVAEWGELLIAVTERCGDDEQVLRVVDRARAELTRIAPRLTAAEGRRRQAARLITQHTGQKAELARIQGELAAVRGRMSTRILDVLRVPTRPSGPAEPAEPAPDPEAGGWPELPDGWDENDGPALAYVDHPQPAAVVVAGETLLIAGWAFAARRPVSKVEVSVDGERAGAARLGYIRRDVHAQYGIPHALLCGFDFRCDPATIRGRDRITVEIQVETMDGRRSLAASREVWVARTVETPAQAIPAAPPRTAESFNLLVVTHDLGFGGGQLWLVELLDRMGAGRDFPCTVMTPQSGPLAAAVRRLGIDVHVNGWIPTDRADAYEGRLAEQVAWAAPCGFSAVLVNTFLAFSGADLAMRLGLPCAWAIHESWPPEVFWSVGYPPGGVARLVKSAAARALAACDRVIFEADATRALYAKATRPGSAAVVRYGIPTQAIRDYCATVDQAAARKQQGLTGFRRILLVMGTVEPRKWQTMLALAFQQVAAEHPDTALVFVGAGDTPYVRGLTEYLGLIGLDHQVRVEPVVADTYPWYRAADAFICASDVESMPRSVLEAMAFGIPICAAAVFGIPELLTDGETGLLFEGADLTAAVAALRRLLTIDPAKLTAIAVAGQQHVCSEYDSAGYAERFTELLRELSDESPAGTR